MSMSTNIREMSEYDKLRSRAMSESELQASIVEMAQNDGYHTFWIPDWIFRLAMGSLKRSPRKGRQWSPPGFPDLVLAKDGRLIFAELKSETGRIRTEQRQWLEVLDGIAGIESYVWRPRAWISGEIELVLTGKKR